MNELSVLVLVVLAVLLTIIMWNNKAESYMKSAGQNYVSVNPSKRYELESKFKHAVAHHKFKFKLHPN